MKKEHMEQSGSDRPEGREMRRMMVVCMILSAIIFALPIVQIARSRSSGSGHNEGDTFLYYDGPVLPLTLSEADAALTAERGISYDFVPPPEGTEQFVMGAQVEDSYVLSGSGAGDKTITAIYPFVGSFYDLHERQPEIKIDGTLVTPTLYVGGHSVPFMETYGGEAPLSSYNSKLNGWTRYRLILEDGAYREAAFSEFRTLTQPVTVYSLSDFSAPDGYDAATLAVSFTIDPEKTAILTYGFDGARADGNGYRRYSFSVPERGEAKLLVVTGEDITDYALQGYRDGSCEKSAELDGVSATVTRTENTLSDVLDGLIGDYFEEYEGGYRLAVSRALFLGAVSELIPQDGPLAGVKSDRLRGGYIEDAISDACHLMRVCYLAFPLTIPAGETVQVSASFYKEPSFDFVGAERENRGVQGYDMLTGLDSKLRIERLTATLHHTDSLEIVRQNYGFDLPRGVTTVALDPQTERYYLELRVKE